MRCEICNKIIKETFLKKIVGTYIKDRKGKIHIICDECQKIYGSKENLLKKL